MMETVESIILNGFNFRKMTSENLDKLFELNPNRREHIRPISVESSGAFGIGGYQYAVCEYIFVEDVLMNPYDVRDFLISSSYVCEQNGAPGMQQVIANDWVRPYLKYLYYLLHVKNIVKEGRMGMNHFAAYTNVFWKEMPCRDINYHRPHIDPGDYAFNLFLSDTFDEDDGTAVYSLTHNYEKWVDVIEMESGCGLRLEEIYKMMYPEEFGVRGMDKWKCFKGDKDYALEGIIPAQFNCISGYKGSLFHSPHYDISKYPDGHLRYSLVSMVAPGVLERTLSDVSKERIASQLDKVL